MMQNTIFFVGGGLYNEEKFVNEMQGKIKEEEEKIA